MNEQQQYKSVDKFDKLMGTLADLPDVAHSKASTVVDHTALIGATQTFVIQTFRQIDRDGDVARSRDTVFLQAMDADGHVRLVIPHKAVDAIVRQREAITVKLRKKMGREQAAMRKARGEQPAFLKKK